MRVLEIKVRTHDMRLGGKDCDCHIMDFGIQDLKQTHHRRDMSGNGRAARRLGTHCERAEQVLRSSTVAMIKISINLLGADYVCPMSRVHMAGVQQGSLPDTQWEL